MMLFALAVIAASPANFQATIAAAPTGSEVHLTAGSYPPAYLRPGTVPKGVTITADPGAVVASMAFISASGVTIKGVGFDGAGVQPFGVRFVGGDHNAVTMSRFSGFTSFGVMFQSSDDGSAVGNTFTRSGSDGIDVAASHRIIIDRNVCMSFAPTPGAHPDCIQLWSVKGTVPVADVTITNNTGIGNMQGISGYNALDGGFDRVTITGNFMETGFPNAIVIQNCRSCVIGGAGALMNHVRTYPGSKWTAKLQADAVTTVLENDVRP